MSKKLDDYQKEYVLEINEKIETLNSLVLSIEQRIKRKLSFERELNEFIIIVHTTKGSAGSYGFNLASTICHNIEDVLETHQSKEMTLEVCDELLSLIDLLKEYFEAPGEVSGERETDFKQKMVNIKAQSCDYDHKVIIVEPSKSLQKIYHRYLKDKGIGMSFCTTGYEALGRILQEPFDSVISANQTEILDGQSLIKLIKVLFPSSEIKTSLVSSTSLLKTEPQFSPDYILLKDKNLGISIEKVYTDLLNNEKMQTKKDLVIEDMEPLQNIVYIDDDPALHKLVQIALQESKDLKIHHFISGLDALKEIDNIRPQLILLDLMMPDISGQEVHEQLKSKESTKDIPVVYMTGMQSKEEHDEMIKRGAMSIIQKPFRPKDLFKKILLLWADFQHESVDDNQHQKTG